MSLDPRWLAWKLDPNSSKLNTPLIFELHGVLNFEALSKAVSAYINEFHQSARCYFDEHDNIVEQRFLDSIPVDIEIIRKKQELKQQKIDSIIQEFCSQPFDLSRSPLFKFGLLTLTEQHCIFIVNFHHAISDAFTGGYLVETLSKLYNHFAKNTPYPNVVGASYPDCMKLAQGRYAVLQQKEDLDFWKEKLSNVPLTVDFSFKKGNIKREDFSNSRYFSVDEKTTLVLKQMARNLGTTPFIILSALYALVLHRYTNQKIIALTYSINTRPPGYQDMPGCFVNDVPFVFDFSNKLTFEALFKASTEERKASKPHQRCLLMNIIQELKRKPLLENWFNDSYFNVSIHEAFLNQKPLSFSGIDVSCWKIVSQALHNDLSLFYQISDRLEFRLDYRTECFDLSLIDRFVLHFIDIVKRSLCNLDEDVNHFSLLQKPELELIQSWNNTVTEFPAEKTLHQLFLEQVMKTPDAVAVSYKKTHLSYRALNLKANALSEMICQALETNADFFKAPVIVALCLDRGLEWPVGMLGILKAGYAYLPIDINDAEYRIKKILDNADIKIILSQKSVIKKLPFLKNNKQIIELDLDKLNINVLNKTSLFKTIPRTNLACVIYTSGTTGQPKGVMVEHGSIVNLVWDVKNRLNFRDSDSVLSVTSITFDIYGLELFLALLTGAKHIICPKESIQDPLKFSEVIQTEKPRFLQATPSFFSMVIPYLKRQEQLVIFCGGEALTEGLLQNLLNITDQVWNVYGPTETTIWSSYFNCKKNCLPYIGRGFSNTKLFVLDEALNLTPPGVIGELYISGVGLAKGYLNDIALTNQKFIHNSKTGERLYKTNDLVRWTEDGFLEYIGRSDSQIKIRGHRIELTEIESVLQKHPLVVSAVVDFNNQADQGNLVAYYIVKKRNFILKWLFKSKHKETLNTYLKKHLPNYMMPFAYVEMEALPLMVNGKIDKRQLPTPLLEHFLGNQSTTQFFDVLEVQLECLWNELLGTSQISPNDNFFDMGGNSLLAVRLVYKINEKFNTQYNIPWILENDTIKTQAFDLRKNENIIPPYNPVIIFNKSGHNIPLFLVHPGLAGAEAYREFAQHLDKSIPLYAIDSYNLNGGGSFLKSVEALAQKYIDYMRSIQPIGPYFLGGWSLGGVIAYEMAQQLTRMGEKVDRIMLLDSQLYSDAYLDFIYARTHLKGLMNMLPKDRGEYMASLPRSYLDRIVTSLKNDMQLLKNYVIKPYSGKVSLIKTTEKTSLNRGLIENTYNGWKKSVKNLELIPIRANHFNLMGGEQVKKLVELIGKSQ